MLGAAGGMAVFLSPRWAFAQVVTLTADPVSGVIAHPLVRSGISINLSAALVATDRPTLIWADVVTVIGTILTGGHALTVVARQLRFAKDAAIDTRGPLPEGFANRAPDGRSAGEDGKDGVAASAGPSGGDLVLVADSIEGEINIVARGQDGGAAQSGGNGAPGQAGAEEREACRAGPAGGQGGRGGLAGAPGAGGSGGKVSIYADSIRDRDPDVDISAGREGKPSVHGKPGAGGPGGAGGKRQRECESKH